MTFYLEKLFFGTYCCFLSLFKGRLLPLKIFFSYDLYLNLSNDEFIFFFYGIVSKCLYFFFMFIFCDEPLFCDVNVGLTSYFFPFWWIYLLIYFKSYDALTRDFLLFVEQFENRSYAYYASSFAQLRILPSFLFLS